MGFPVLNWPCSPWSVSPVGLIVELELVNWLTVFVSKFMRYCPVVWSFFVLSWTGFNIRVNPSLMKGVGKCSTFWKRLC